MPLQMIWLERAPQQHQNISKPSASRTTCKPLASRPTHMGGCYQVPVMQGALQGSSDAFLKQCLLQVLVMWNR